MYCPVAISSTHLSRYVRAPHQDGTLSHSVKGAFPLDGMPPLTPPLPHRNGATPHPLPRISPAIGVTPPPSEEWHAW